MSEFKACSKFDCTLPSMLFGNPYPELLGCLKIKILYSQKLEDLETHSLRRLASARFTRNQRMLADIFNENCVPDVRNIVTAPRLAML